MSKGVFLTGATSGIGEALAEELAKSGEYKLALLGRRQDRLEAIQKHLKETYPNIVVEIRPLDVANSDDVFLAWKEMLEKLGNIDVVIANAGTSSKGRVGHGNFNNHKECIQVNLLGAMATIDCAVEHFKKVGTGHVVGVSSVTGFRGIPKLSAYSASKAALNSYLDALRCELLGTKIKVTTFFPGWVETEMTGKLTNKPFCISSKECARLMVRDLRRKVEYSLVPFWPWILVKWLIDWIPKKYMKVFG
jgi:short-subunit dehydrogenase